MNILLGQLPMVEKLPPLALSISKEKGEFALFGLFLREEASLPSVTRNRPFTDSGMQITES